MLPYLREQWGNPSSLYRFGRQVRDAIEEARESVATLIGARSSEIVFTSCGTESTNTALFSSMLHDASKGHCLMSTVEHAANVRTGEALEAQGFEVAGLPVDSNGVVDLDQMEDLFRPETAVVSVMWANNETGVVSPIAEIGERVRRRGLLFHSDAVQAAGKIRIDVEQAGVDYLSLSGHKIYAPKGVGVLYVREGAPFRPLIVGGGQEKGRRAGTQNVPYVVGMGAAAQLVHDELERESTRLGQLRDRMESDIVRLTGASVHGGHASRLPNTSNLAFDGIEAEALLLLLEKEGVCASSGSACSTGSLEPSPVLVAMGVSRSAAMGSVRFSLGRLSSDSDVDHLVAVLPPLIQRLRGAVPG